jgi:hypothetical protein
MADYVSLSRRLSGKEQVLHRGVPPHLEHPLIEWMNRYETHEILRNAALTSEVWYAPSDPRYQRVSTLVKGIQAATDPAKAFLDVVDRILFLLSHEADNETLERWRKEKEQTARECSKDLETILHLGGSYWRVRGDHLEARVDDNVREAVERARNETETTSASTHLGNAWLACYGRNPNPGHGYGEAIKAVEAAAAPVVTPNDLKAQLGKMRGELEANNHLWRFSIAPGDIKAVIDAMTTLEKGQTDRHAGNLQTKPVTPDAAQAAVLLAATLVHWFATGAVKRR